MPNLKESIGKTYNLGGIKMVTWKEIIHQIALASGKLTWKIPAPVIAVKIAVLLLDRFQWFPVTKDQLSMLIEGNTVNKHYFLDFDIAPIPFEIDNLSYLNK